MTAAARDPFEALGDPNRRAIVELLAEGGRSVGEVADALPISRPAVSQHLRVLERAQLVRGEKAGTRRLYSAEPRGLLELQRYLQTYWGDALRAFQAAARAAEKEEKE